MGTYRYSLYFVYTFSRDVIGTLDPVFAIEFPRDVKDRVTNVS